MKVCRLKRFLSIGVALFSMLSILVIVRPGIAPAGGLADSAWPGRGHDSRHTGRSPYPATQTNTLKWSYQTGGDVDSSPVIAADGTIYIGSNDGKLYALDPNGSLKWEYQTSSYVDSTPAIAADGTIYIGSNNGQIYALKPEDGTLKWKYQTRSEIHSSPAIALDGTVYIGSWDGQIYALKPEDGTLKWKYQTGASVHSSPSIGADGTVYVGSNDHKLYALKPEDGTLKWSYETDFYIYSSPAVGTDGTIYVGSGWWREGKMDGKIYALNTDGTLKWKYQTGGDVYSSPAIDSDGTVYVGSNDGNLYALGPDGALRWSYQTEAMVHSSPTIGAEGTVYVGSDDGHIYALNADGTLIWSYQTGGDIYSSPAIGSDGTVYVASRDQKLYAFSPIRCLDNSQCLSGEFCQKKDCTQQGICSPQPEECLTLYDPVCGCDGITYANSCEAARQGVSIDYKGECSEQRSENAWPGKGYNARRTGLSPYVGAQTSNLKWSYKTGYWVGSSPAVGAAIYVGSYDGRLYALDPNGEPRWSYQTGGRVVSSPAIGADGTVYVGSENGRVYAFKPDGKPKWSQVLGLPLYSSPVIGTDTTVYIGSGDGQVYALNPDDGSSKWSYQTGDRVDSPPAIGSDGTIYVGSNDGRVYALKAEDGSLKWSYQTGDRVTSSPAIGADGTIYIASYDGNLYALGVDGSLKWSYKIGLWSYSSPAIGPDGTIYIGSQEIGEIQVYCIKAPCPPIQGDYGVIKAINPDGTLKWKYQTGDSIASSPAIGADGTIYFGSRDDWLYALNPDGTLKWKYKTGDDIYSSPAIGADGTVYIGSNDGKVYAFGASSCVDNSQCLAGEFCQKTAGECSAQGVCSLQPQECIMLYDPVRGCDGIIYSNSCEAARHGVNVDYSVPPSQTEVCDGLDNNGDGQVDEDLKRPCYTSCGTGIETCQVGQWICGAPQPQTYYADDDQDGYGNASKSRQSCSAPLGYVKDNHDCNDADPSVHPGATEIFCNGQDDDCLNGDDCGPQTECVEDDSGAVDIEASSASIDSEVRIPVRIQSIPFEVESLGFDVAFDSTVLEYSGFERGELMANATLFDVSTVEPGQLRVGGLSTTEGLARGTSGYLIWLKFKVKGGLENECYPLNLKNLEDDLASFSGTGGCFCLTRHCDGDLNGDNKVTPADALIAFKCYLGTGTCPDCADVNQDGKVTPSDALCLFKKYLGQPSCLD